MSAPVARQRLHEGWLWFWDDDWIIHLGVAVTAITILALSLLNPTLGCSVSITQTPTNTTVPHHQETR